MSKMKEVIWLGKEVMIPPYGKAKTGLPIYLPGEMATDFVNRNLAKLPKRQKLEDQKGAVK